MNVCANFHTLMNDISKNHKLKIKTSMLEDLNEIQYQIKKIGNVFRVTNMLQAVVYIKQP